jgi:hypothetical protein
MATTATVDTITKESFLQYLKKRKDLDQSFGKQMVEAYKQKEDMGKQKIKRQMARREEKMESDPAYREMVIAKRKEYYRRKKAEKDLESQKPVEPVKPVEPASESDVEPEPVKPEPMPAKSVKPPSNFNRLNIF